MFHDNEYQRINNSYMLCDVTVTKTVYIAIYVASSYLNVNQTKFISIGTCTKYYRLIQSNF